jgi:hypothetical protein
MSSSLSAMLRKAHKTRHDKMVELGERGDRCRLTADGFRHQEKMRDTRIVEDARGRQPSADGW